MNSNCSPPQSPTAVAALNDPCAYLAALRMALLNLMSGQARSQVRFENSVLQFHAPNIRELRLEIMKYETLCLQPGGRATQVGRFNPALASFGFGRNRYY